MSWSGWPTKTAAKCWLVIGDWCVPWWKRIEKPESMTRPDTRTEKVIERLELVASRMENVAKVLSDDMDVEEAEQRQLRRVVKEAQGGRPDRAGRVEDGESDGGAGA